MITTEMLSAYTWRQLVEAAKVANHGAIGFDPNRDSPTNGYVRGKSPKDALCKWVAATAEGNNAAGEVYYHLTGKTMPEEAAHPPKDKVEPASTPAKHTPTQDKHMNATRDPAKIGQTMLELFGSAPVDEDTVRSIVHEEVSKTRPTVIEVRQPTGEAVKLDGFVNPAFKDVLDMLNAGLHPLMVGPSGCGKTHMAQQIFKVLKCERTAIVSGSAGASEASLTGRLLPSGDNGKFEWHDSQFVQVYENGGGILQDELDAFDPNMLIVSNSAMANGGFSIEARTVSGMNAWIDRHPDAYIMGAANTYGTGPDAMYVGRFQLDAATLDRWVPVYVDYDREMEKAMSAKWAEWVHEVREAAQKSRLQRIVSTRMIQKAAALESVGWDDKKIKATMLAGWSKDETNKVPA